MKILSIIVTTYNRSEFLRELLHQLAIDLASFEDKVELVVADNASSDGTSATVAAAQASGLQIKYIKREKNLGFSLNLAHAISEACGRYVWPLCDDDSIELHVIAKVVASLRVHEGVGVFLLNKNIYDVTMRRCLRSNCLNCDNDIVLPSAFIVEKYASELLTASCVIIRRDLASLGASRAEYVGFFCETLVIACEALDGGGGMLLGSVAVRYREGNTGAWNVWWPVISVYYMPLVIAQSKLSGHCPTLVDKFVNARGGDIFEGLSRISSSGSEKIRESVDLSKLRRLYRSMPKFDLAFSFAFELPRFIPLCYAALKAIVRYVKMQQRGSKLNPLMLFSMVSSKYREFKRKERV